MGYIGRTLVLAEEEQVDIAVQEQTEAMVLHLQVLVVVEVPGLEAILLRKLVAVAE